MITGPIPVGDSAAEYRAGTGISPDVNARVHALDRALRTHPFPGLIETVPAYDTLLAVVEPGCTAPPPPAIDTGETPGRHHDVPVRYGGEFGPDLEAVADHAGITPARVIDLHTAATYPVYCIGFSPGFTYLGGLDPALHCPRLASPRTTVPAGSVAIGGGQTGIYPLPTPGGWRLLGRTPWQLFTADSDPPLRIVPGDRVRFHAVSDEEYKRLQSEREEPAPVGIGLTVINTAPGATIQDRGRTGCRRYGVGTDGALDQLAYDLCNLLVANEPGMAALEAFGPLQIRLNRDTIVAVTGGVDGMEIDGRTVPAGVTAPVTAGQTVALPPPTHSMVSYLAIGGGIDVPFLLGSRSAGAAGAGPSLRPGDQLPLGIPRLPTRDIAGRKLDPRLWRHDRRPVAVLPGPDDTPGLSDHHTIATTGWTRTGIRLHSASPVRTDANLVSTGVIPGVVQVPGDGHPIVLLRGCGTMGGYRRALTVVSGELDRLTAFAPGQEIRFRRVDRSEAARINHERNLRLASARSDLGEARSFSLRVGGRTFAVSVEPLDVLPADPRGSSLR